MNFKGFKKVSQDDQTATFQHEKTGHKLMIAHKNLSPKLKTQLDALPIHSFADGGEVKGVSEDDEADVDESQKAKPMPMMDLPGTPARSAEPVFVSPEMGVPADASANPNIVSASPDAPAGQAGPVADAGPGPANPPAKVESDPFGTVAATQGQLAGLEEQKLGQMSVAKATGNLGAAQAKIEAAHQGEMAQHYKDFEAANKTLTDERVALQNDIAKGHIDPNRYIDSMSTGKAIRTGIGLILGGMGAGLSRGPNLAFQFLQNQIDRDINAQKAELGKKENLLTHNIQSATSLRAGMEMTRIHSNDIVSSQLRQEADKAQDPIQKGNLLNIAGMFDAQSAQLQKALAVEKLQQSAFSGNGAVSSAVMETLPPEKRERAVQMPGGGLRLAISPDGAKMVREQLQTIQPIYNSLDQLTQLGAAALVPGSAAAQKANAIRAQLIPLVNENAGLKRLSAEDIGNIREMFTDPTKFSSLLGGAKTNAFKNFLQDKLISTMGQQLEGSTGGKSVSAGHNFGFQPKAYVKGVK